MKRLLFYSYVYNGSVAEFLNKLSEHEEAGEEVALKVNSGGGDVFAGWGLINEIQKCEAIKQIEVHGNASSMWAFALCFFENTQAISQSKFVLHRASAWGDTEQPEVKKFVEQINKDFKAAFESRLNLEKLEKISGVDMNRFWDMSQTPIDIVLNAKQAKDIGLIKKVVNLTAKQAQAINEKLVAANVPALKIEEEKPEPEAKTDKKVSKMNIETLKAEHKEVFNDVLKQGATAAMKAEKERVKAWLVWFEIDPEAVKKGIESGEAISPSETQEMILAGQKKGFKAELEDKGKEGAEKTEKPTGETDEEKEVTGFLSEVYAELGIKVKG